MLWRFVNRRKKEGVDTLDNSLQMQHREVMRMQGTTDPEITIRTEYYESDGNRMAMDVYLPNREAFAKIRPGILFFFGGGFLVGWRKAFQHQAAACARQGYVAFCADYRIKAFYETTPWESMCDGAAAWEHIRRNADRWQVDPERMVLSGGSAGGLIALMCGRITGVWPAGLALFNPAVPDAGRKDEPVSVLVGSGIDGICVMDSLLPDPDMCPVLILHGEGDQTVPAANIRRFALEAAALGRDVTVKIYPGVGHGFFQFFRNRAHYYLTTGELLIFLQKICSRGQ